MKIAVYVQGDNEFVTVLSFDPTREVVPRGGDHIMINRFGNFQEGPRTLFYKVEYVVFDYTSPRREYEAYFYVTPVTKPT